MWQLVKGLGEIKVEDIHYIPLVIYNCQYLYSKLFLVVDLPDMNPSSKALTRLSLSKYSTILSPMMLCPSLYPS